jgi:DNA-binding NarL/FixJ family response regulator
LLPRECAVLELAAQGLSPYGIALMLRIPHGAVEELLRRCLWRLGAADLRAAIGLARRRRLIE